MIFAYAIPSRAVNLNLTPASARGLRRGVDHDQAVRRHVEVAAADLLAPAAGPAQAFRAAARVDFAGTLGDMDVEGRGLARAARRALSAALLACVACSATPTRERPKVAMVPIANEPAGAADVSPSELEAEDAGAPPAGDASAGPMNLGDLLRPSAAASADAGDAPPSAPPLDPRTGYRLGPDTEITLERTGCFGPCPVYSVTIAADGAVRFHGLSHTAIAGVRVAKIGRAAVQRLLSFLAAHRFHTLPDRYPSLATDHPGTITTLRQGRASKRVEHDRSDARATAILAITREIDRVAGTARWVEPAKRGQWF